MTSARDRSTPEILVVDDEARVRSVLKVGLRRYGYLVLTAASAREALQQSQHPPEMVLLDVVLPDLDGPATLKALRRLHPSIRVCFLGIGPDRSTFEPFSHRHLMNLGAEAVLNKRFLEEIPRVLAEYLLDPNGPAEDPPIRAD